MEEFKPLFDAVMSGQYVLAAALALVVAVAALRKYGAKIMPWVNTPWGAVVLVLLTSLGGALAAALAAGAAPSWAMVKTAFLVAVTAAGGWKVLRELVAPVLRRVRDKLPAPLRPVLDVVLWIFDRPDPVAKAKAAGEQAVKDKPSTGAAASSGGKVRDFD